MNNPNDIWIIVNKRMIVYKDIFFDMKDFMFGCKNRNAFQYCLPTNISLIIFALEYLRILHKPSWQISCFCENIDSYLSNDKKQRNNLYIRMSKHF